MKATVSTITVKIDSMLTERIQRLADARHLSADSIIRTAISQYIEREEKHDAFHLDGTKAWNDYQANGLHVTHAEADAWLAKLEAGEDLEPPECHV